MTANRKKAPEYLKDDHLSVGTKEYLKVWNSGDKPVESLSVPEARKVLVTAQASVKTDLSGIEESEKTITVDDHMLRLNISVLKVLRKSYRYSSSSTVEAGY